MKIRYFDEYEYMGNIESNGFIPANNGMVNGDIWIVILIKVSTFEYDQALPFLNGIAAVKKGDVGSYK